MLMVDVSAQRAYAVRGEELVEGISFAEKGSVCYMKIVHWYNLEFRIDRELQRMSAPHNEL